MPIAEEALGVLEEPVSAPTELIELHSMNAADEESYQN